MQTLIVEVLRLRFDPAHLHQYTSNNYIKGHNDPFQCSFNVPKKETLSKKTTIKTNKLNNIKRYLIKYDLLNDKYLTKRKEIYYFNYTIDKDNNCQYSLKTTNYLISNILKYKILLKIKEELQKMNENDLLNKFNRNLTVFKTDTSINIQSENDEEKSLIEDITKKTIRSIKKRGIKKIQSNDLSTVGL